MEYLPNYKLRDIMPRKYSQVISILANVVSNNKINLSLFCEMSPKEWNELLELSIKHGIVAVIFESIIRNNLFPTSFKNDNAYLTILMKWMGYSQIIKKEYSKQKGVAKELANLLYKNDISMLVLKGISLAYLYKTPECRSFGDLDIYTYG